MQTATTVSNADVEKHRNLVAATVARVTRRVPTHGDARQDLEAAAMFGLLDALMKKGTRTDEEFSWYASVRIRGAVIDELRRRDWISRAMRTRVRRERAAGGEAITVAPAVQTFEHSVLDQLAGTATDDSPFDTLQRHRGIAAVRDAVAKLRERDGAILRMHYFEAMAFQEIARVLGVSPARVSQLHARALRVLRELLTDDLQVA